MEAVRFLNIFRGSVVGGPVSSRESIGRTGVLSLVNLVVGHGDVTVLRGVNLVLDRGEAIALVGPSGSGKSTLLHAVAGLVPLSSGEVNVDGMRVSGFNDRARRAWRLQSCGLVFQFGELVPEMTLRENAEFPGRLLGRDPVVVRESVDDLLNRVGLTDVADRVAAQVSGGQMQRGAIVRALAHQPALVLADEPTGALDEANSGAVLQMLIDLCADQGANLIVATHDTVVQERLARVVRLSEGRLSG